MVPSMSSATWRIRLSRRFMSCPSKTLPCRNSFAVSWSHVKLVPNHGGDSNNLHRALRQRVKKRLAILLGENAVVQHDDDAVVGLRPNQSAYALPEFQNRHGQRKLAEGIPAARLDRLDARLDEGMIRHGERQARDNDVAQRLARHVHALTEADRKSTRLNSSHVAL